MREGNMLFRKHRKVWEKRDDKHLGKIKCIAELGIGGVRPGKVRNKSRCQTMNSPIVVHVLDVKKDVWKMLNKYWHTDVNSWIII